MFSLFLRSVVFNTIPFFFLPNHFSHWLIIELKEQGEKKKKSVQTKENIIGILRLKFKEFVHKGQISVLQFVLF